MIRKGQRVRVISDSEGHSPVGATGTALEDSSAPWVVMDKKEYTTYNSTCVCKPDLKRPRGWKDGYMNCLTEDELEVIEEGT